MYGGPYQNESGSDGKGDTPYTIGPDAIDNYPLMEPYSWSPHGIGIASLALSKAVVGQGYSVRIETTILNQGVYPETLGTTLYAQNQADKFIIQTQTITLPEESPTRLTFTWNTSGFLCGKYTIGANATLIPSETDTTDNNLTDGWIIVTIPGDVTGEGLCDMQDISILIDAFLAYPGDLRWNPNCDVNGDSSVDMADISIAIDHFMQTQSA